MITVKSTRPYSRVVLWERHPDHPDGEVFIADEAEYEVAETAAVKARLNDGRLVQVGEALPIGPSLADLLGDDVAGLLADAGYITSMAIRDADDDDLLAIDGIGAKRLATIREALG